LLLEVAHDCGAETRDLFGAGVLNTREEGVDLGDLRGVSEEAGRLFLFMGSV